MKIILASKSPRRKELLDLLNLKYEIMASDKEEIIEPNFTIEQQAKKLAYEKAKTIFDKTKGDRIVIGSDTMVIKEGKIYGKPKDKQDAFRMLEKLKGAKHEVITGLAILVQKEGKEEQYIDYDKAEVYLKDMTKQEIEHWIATGNALDKAGAYAVQGEFMVFIQKIQGHYATIMGLPIHKVYEVLKKILYEQSNS